MIAFTTVTTATENFDVSKKNKIFEKNISNADRSFNARGNKYFRKS